MKPTPLTKKDLKRTIWDRETNLIVWREYDQEGREDYNVVLEGENYIELEKVISAREWALQEIEKHEKLIDEIEKITKQKIDRKENNSRYLKNKIFSHELKWIVKKAFDVGDGK